MLAFNLRTWLRQRPTAEEIRLHITRWNDAALGRVKRHEPSVLWLAGTHAGKLDELARETLVAAPDDLARFALAVAHEVDGSLPPVDGLSPELAARVRRLAAALTAASRPIVISGASCGSETLLRAAATLAAALRFAGEQQTGTGESEAGGARASAAAGGSAPAGAGAGGRRPALPRPARAEQPRPGAAGRRRASATPSPPPPAGDPPIAVVLENDLYRRAPAAAVDDFFAGCAATVVLDGLATPTLARADLALPAADWAEATGTYVTSTGIAQRSFKVMESRGEARESWRWLRDLLHELGRPEGQWRGVDDVLAALAADQPQPRARRARRARRPRARVAGMPVARMAPRASGRTAMYAHLSEHEPPPAADQDAPFELQHGGRGGPDGRGAAGAPAAVLGAGLELRPVAAQAFRRRSRGRCAAVPPARACSAAAAAARPSGAERGAAGDPAAHRRRRRRSRRDRASGCSCPAASLLGRGELSARSPASPSSPRRRTSRSARPAPPSWAWPPATSSRCRSTARRRGCRCASTTRCRPGSPACRPACPACPSPRCRPGAA